MYPAIVPAPQAPPGLEDLTQLVLDGVASPITKAMYKKALGDFFAWWAEQGRPPFAKAAVQAHKSHLEAKGYAASTVNQRLAALRKLALEAADAGWLPLDRAAAIQRVKGVRRLGVRLGNWLTEPAAQALLNAPDPETLKGKRDRAVLATLVGCGLRRSEAARLTVADLQQREGRWILLDLTGKHGRVRSVPMPPWVKAAFDDWLTAAAIAEGSAFRAIDRAGRVGDRGLTPQSIFDTVRAYAEPLGLAVRPHDLRRTCAKLCRTRGGELEQIQLLLGHASIQVTERYLGTKQNLAHAPNDRLGFEWGPSARKLAS